MPEDSAQSRPDWWPTNPYPVDSAVVLHDAWEAASSACFAAFMERQRQEIAVIRQRSDEACARLDVIEEREGGAA